ncbi:calcium channel flower-like isoform X1 [Penaeus chinensis]|uniref:calcium channel flower-like isoform X1 n=2 Tax=Penaeus chinensis TaxID=139456 RepID=UPI001FB7EAFD|nr:calcium channel flower-like isoform X1 [Penaeus chinensis]XP_047502768.1 calcium channel flower-like isoform X1 [Penaeus chinensis]XP_047502769.1 calcium channel flower-like isoform X1 [Penaeus chinensis]
MIVIVSVRREDIAAWAALLFLKKAWSIQTVAMGLGVFTCVTFSPICVVAGIWQMLAAFIVISAEAPCCCMFVDFVQQYSMWVEGRPHWQKAVFYIVIALPAVILCPGLSTIFGSGLIFLSGVLYGLMTLGKKGSREDMIAAAQQNTGPVNSQSAILVDDPEAWRST